MIFEALYESAQRGELLLIDGGYCRYHLKADGFLTIYEIIATKKGSGTKLLNILKCIRYAKWIIARCPADLESNQWYEKKEFTKIATERTIKNNREINVWCLIL